MSSFYGGRKGESFVIAKSFYTVDEMEAFVARGSETLNEVGYGQFMIIDTLNKANLDNGKLYKRGFEGAEYVARIVGPPGPAPKIEPVAYDTKQVWDGEASFSPEYDLVPGSTTDEIKYRWAYVQDENGNYVAMKIGSKVPYTVFNFDSESVDWNTEPQVIEQADSINRPFYYNLKFQIPDGTPGSDIENIELITKNDKTYVKFSIIEYSKDNGQASTERKSFELPFNDIQKLSLSDDGTLTIDYSYADTEQYSQLLKWLAKEDSVTVSPNGTITIKYNTGEVDTLNQKLKWIQNVVLNDSDQKIHIIYNDNTDEAIGQPINYILDSVITPITDNNPFHLYVLYSDPAKRAASSITYNGIAGWTDLGYVKGDPGGLHIIGELDSINQLYKDGQPIVPSQILGWTEERDGWGYLIDKEIYVYDYINKDWISIGGISPSAEHYISISSLESEALSKLDNNGIWFVSTTSKSAE